MAMSKEVAAEHLMLPFIFVVANIVLAIPAAKSCGSALYRLLLTCGSGLALECFATVMLLLAAQIVFVTNAEARTVSAARAAASARGEAFDAAAAAARRGISSVPAGWKRGSLRGLLLLTVVLNVAACFNPIVVFEGGFLDRTGCHPGYGANSPVESIVMCVMVVVHSCSARMAWHQIQN